MKQAFAHHGIEYHVLDFVYLKPNNNTASLYNIGHIIKIIPGHNKVQVVVKCLSRDVPKEVAKRLQIQAYKEVSS